MVDVVVDVVVVASDVKGLVIDILACLVDVLGCGALVGRVNRCIRGKSGD